MQSNLAQASYACKKFNFNSSKPAKMSAVSAYLKAVSHYKFIDLVEITKILPSLAGGTMLPP